MNPPYVTRYPPPRLIGEQRSKCVRLVFRGQLSAKQVNVPAIAWSLWIFASAVVRLKGPVGESVPVTNSEEGIVSPRET
jgi:hypothetical protein